MALYHLQIVTPDRMVYDGEAERVLVRAVEGDVCILAGHVDYAAALTYGEAKLIDADGQTHTAACCGGFISVSEGKVKIAATTFEWSGEIDVTRAERAREAAEHALENAKRGDRVYAVAEAKLKRALARLNAASK